MAHPNLAQDDEDDPLDPSHFHLETAFYDSGHAVGLSEGSHAGRIEGRLFGLEKGFEKFAEMGRLRGRAEVWGARLEGGGISGGEGRGKHVPLPGRGSGSEGGNERLAKRIQRLQALTDPETLGRENSEEAVDEVDERLRDARTRAAVIARIVGDESFGREEREVFNPPLGPLGQSAESVRKDGLRVKGQAEGKAKTKGSGEMEDFAGLPGGR